MKTRLQTVNLQALTYSLAKRRSVTLIDTITQISMSRKETARYWRVIAEHLIWDNCHVCKAHNWNGRRHAMSIILNNRRRAAPYYGEFGA